MYQHGKRVSQPQNYKVFLFTLAVIGIVVLGVWYLIHKDIAGDVGPKSNVPIISNVKESDDTITIDTPYFSFDLPNDWRLQQEIHESYANTYVYHSTAKGEDDRTLFVHMDVIPKSYKIVKLLPITPNGNKFIVGTVSEDCVNFSGTAEQRQSTAEFQAKWQDAVFMCDPISTNQTIGTASKQNGIGVPLTGTTGTHTFFFYFEDHNIRPDDNIFVQVLSTFRAK